jgi:outer membrane protein assembly factor BamE (lipoprotein component of BamABCDE complex)
MPTPRRARLLPTALVALPLLGGCHTFDVFSFPPQARGAEIDPDQLAQLVPGTSTRKDVAALLGTPTTKASFDDNTWIYISQITRPVIAATQGVLHQHVYVVTFDGAGTLTRIAQKDRADALPVQVVQRTTPSPGSEATFMQQLIGNIGRFNPNGQPASAGPSGTGPGGNGGGGGL